MVSKEELKQIVMFRYLTEIMLDKLVPNIDLLVFEKGSCVFREGDIADRFYLLKRGTVLLEKRISANIKVSVGTIKAGFSFGWSAILEEEHYTSEATCSEACETFSVRSEKVRSLMEADHSMGYILSQRVLRVIKKRLDIRTEQFLRVISNHPDLKSLL